MAQIDTADEAQQQPPRAYTPRTSPKPSSTASRSSSSKPRARGWIHVYAAIVAVIAGAALVSVSWSLESTRAGSPRCSTR